MLAAHPDGTLYCLYGENTMGQTATATLDARMVKSTDGGKTWSAAWTVFSAANRFHNKSFGITREGKFILLLQQGQLVGGAYVVETRKLSCLTSWNGIDWIEEFVFSDSQFESAVGLIVLWGRVEQVGNTLVAAAYNQSASTTSRAYCLKSVDNGKTWTAHLVNNATLNGLASENFIIPLNEQVYFLLARNAANNTLVTGLSTDAGLNWSFKGSILTYTDNASAGFDNAVPVITRADYGGALTVLYGRRVDGKLLMASDFLTNAISPTTPNPLPISKNWLDTGLKINTAVTGEGGYVSALCLADSGEIFIAYYDYAASTGTIKFAVLNPAPPTRQTLAFFPQVTGAPNAVPVAADFGTEPGTRYIIKNVAGVLMCYWYNGTTVSSKQLAP